MSVWTSQDLRIVLMSSRGSGSTCTSLPSTPDTTLLVKVPFIATHSVTATPSCFSVNCTQSVTVQNT